MTASAPDQAERDRATDIRRSAIVQAPAGSGKTSLLVQRYLKLLAVADRPEEILAITFTRKAASEMANRVLDALHAADAANKAGTPADADAALALERSRQQGWRLLEQPARLKIQTIDSLAMSLTRGLPVAAGLDPMLELTETADTLYRTAAERHLLRLYEEGPLSSEIADFLEQCGNDANRAERLLSSMLSKRDQWLDVVRSVVTTHQQAPDQVAEVLEAAVRALNDQVIDDFRSGLGERLSAELDVLVDHAAATLQQDIRTNHARHRLAAEVLTTQRDEFRRQVNVRQGFAPGDREEKARVMSLIAALSERNLSEVVANLRYLPDPTLPPEAVRRLVTVSINLVLANAELSGTFQASGFTDFTTLILNAQTALGDPEAPTELALALDYRIRHLLVDEFQDTSVSQFRLFERLLTGWTEGDGNTFFAVGDPMQSIYRFRDADVGLFHRAWVHGIGQVPLDQVALTANFRADDRLVRWVNDAFSRILGSNPDPVLGGIAYTPATPTRPADGEDPAVTFLRLPGPAEQIDAVIARIEHLLADTEGSIALLVRNRSHLTRLIRALRERDIRWHANDIDPLLNKPAVRDLLSLVSVLADPRDRLSWFSLLRAPFVGLTLSDLQVLEETEDFPALLSTVAAAVAVPLDGASGVRLQRLARAWQAVIGRLHEVPARSLVETLWLRLGGADAYADPTAVRHAARLLELMDTLGPRALSPDALGQAAVHLFATDLTDSRLEILTVHKAKGLEFDHVLLPFLEKTPRSDEAELLRWRALPEGLLMGVRDDEGPYAWLARENRLRDRHERQRLFYVACTRARRSLTLFAEVEARSRETSMLALLEPAAEATANRSLEVVDVVATAERRPPDQGDLFDLAPEISSPPPLVRLVDDYQWQPPDRIPLPSAAVPAAPAMEDPLAAREEVVLGVIVHAALERLARMDLPERAAAYVSEQQPLWQHQAIGQGLSSGRVVSPEAAARIAAETARQIEGVLGDPEGRRLLTARDAAFAEFAVTASRGGVTENLIIDRTFVEDGMRWIIDYKTSIPPPGMAVKAFVDAEVQRYRGQLSRYGDAVAALFGDTPRLALYLTALPKLILLPERSD